MAPKILIIHDSSVLGTIIQKTIQNYIKEASIERAESLSEITNKFLNQKYDVVISQREMEEIKGIEVYKLMKMNEKNRDASFIILTSSIESIEREIEGYDIKFVLPIPFSPFMLREMVSKAANLKIHRMHERYNIPQTRALINIENHNISADVSNICLGGLLCGFEYPEFIKDQNLLKLSKIDIFFSKVFDNVSIQNVTSVPIRMNIISHYKNVYPKDISIAYKFAELSQEHSDILSKIFKKYSSDYKNT